MVRQMNPQAVYPFSEDFKHFVLIEVASTFDPNSLYSDDDTSGSSSEHESANYLEVDRLIRFIETVEGNILVSEVTSLTIFAGRRGFARREATAPAVVPEGRDF